MAGRDGYCKQKKSPRPGGWGRVDEPGGFRKGSVFWAQASGPCGAVGLFSRGRMVDEMQGQLWSPRGTCRGQTSIILFD